MNGAIRETSAVKMNTGADSDRMAGETRELLRVGDMVGVSGRPKEERADVGGEDG